jgi:lipid-binding SYLF domain-containing protein
MRHLILMFLAICVLPFPAFAAERSDVLQMRADTLARLYKEEPGARTEVEQAVGYAVFSPGGVNVVFFSAGYGSGVAHDNINGNDIFMKMASGGLGLGLGVKDYRLVFVFRTREAYDRFVRDGWDFSSQADVAAKAGTDGGELSEGAVIMPGVKVYQLTENGLVAQITLQGTRYWRD